MKGGLAGEVPWEDVQAVAEALAAGKASLAHELADHVIGLMVELRPPEIAELIHANCVANILVFLDSLGRGVPTTKVASTPEVRDYTRDLARTNLTLESLLRAYRLVCGDVITRWADAVAERDIPDPEAIAVVQYGTTYALDWLDVMCEQVAQEYRAEADRLAQQRSQARLEELRAVLTDADATPDAASRKLGYRMRGLHRALVLRDCSTRPSATVLNAALRTLSSTLGIAEHFAVQPDGRTLWCWLRWPTSMGQQLPKPSEPVLLAAGRPASGLDGFRRSHRDAVDAMNIALVAGRIAGTVTNYADVELAVLCSTADNARTREYIGSTLGKLNTDDEAARRTRETLIAYYEANSNSRATAARLGIHHNTVRYRLKQAERFLGHPVNERRLALEVALHLAETLGVNATPTVARQ
ncbi:putative regulatory protein [Mycobacteroides abscessus subsp. bolletii]|uniref:PucR family transcriptional regulator n=1 Tax=Mycobacteroides abscessus TaxID=36809 RepID=UPI0009A7E96B|nr:helix-turn-helix domain-containing protein [Mycobacteroides abscessus]SKG70746.1 putative regulatory protein [Mycobacteroides abscessus subsp. bolletii]SKH11872.1 putative regulatory protein [Mycobacteroides abscessus subsp. bolletii]